MENIFQLFKNLELKAWYNMFFFVSLVMFFAAVFDKLPTGWDTILTALLSLGGVLIGIGEMSNHVITRITQYHDDYGNVVTNEWQKVSYRRDCLIGWVFNLAGAALWAYTAYRFF